MSYDLVLNRVDHDMVFSTTPEGKYEFMIFDTADRVAQQTKINLLSFLGEWFLDTTYGVPYLEDILIKNPRISTIESIIRMHLNSIPNLTGIQALAIDWNRKGRSLNITYEAETDLGPIQGSYKLELSRNV